MTNLAFIQYRLAMQFRGQGGVGGNALVSWKEISGGTLDPVTQALQGGVETPCSGVIRAFGYEAAAKSVVRQFVEIQAGDLILEVPGDGLVTQLASGVAVGQVALEDIASKGVRFQWGGRSYMQAEMGEDLVEAWATMAADQMLMKAMLLRKAT